MPRGSKDTYTDKQQRKAEHIEDSYKAKGVAEDEAEARAWATVNKQSGGGERSGSGRKKSAAAKADDRKESARRAVATKRGVPRARSAASPDEKTRAQLMEEARARNHPRPLDDAQGGVDRGTEESRLGGSAQTLLQALRRSDGATVEERCGMDGGQKDQHIAEQLGHFLIEHMVRHAAQQLLLEHIAQ